MFLHSHITPFSLVLVALTCYLCFLSLHVISSATIEVDDEL
uniref:Uncharacterized protein n=1 Tax=Arundo donax TaxID=35708 RepID=A0A0A8Z4P4_ARUDO